MEKDINGGRTLKRKEGKGGGFGQNRPLLLPPDQNTTRNRGGVGERRRPWDPASQATAAAGKRGKRKRGARGSDSPTYPEQRWLVEMGQRGLAGGGRNGYGGGAARLGSGLAVAEGVVVGESCEGGLFIGEVRRWRRGRGGWRAPRPLMAVGQLRPLAGVLERGVVAWRWPVR